MWRARLGGGRLARTVVTQSRRIFEAAEGPGRGVGIGNAREDGEEVDVPEMGEEPAFGREGASAYRTRNPKLLFGCPKGAEGTALSAHGCPGEPFESVIISGPQ